MKQADLDRLYELHRDNRLTSAERSMLQQYLADHPERAAEWQQSYVTDRKIALDLASRLDQQRLSHERAARIRSTVYAQRSSGLNPVWAMLLVIVALIGGVALPGRIAALLSQPHPAVTPVPVPASASPTATTAPAQEQTALPTATRTSGPTTVPTDTPVPDETLSEVPVDTITPTHTVGPTLTIAPEPTITWTPTATAIPEASATPVPTRTPYPTAPPIEPATLPPERTPTTLTPTIP